jgi:two-component system C4-dicarboxylate transport response regulator DctD
MKPSFLNVFKKTSPVTASSRSSRRASSWEILYGLALEVFGFTPALARSADEAWALACLTPPAVVVTEVAIPHTDGWTLIHRLRAELSATLPVIVLSTRGDEEAVRVRASAAGCHAVLVKPCPTELLTDTLRDAVSRPRA